MFNVFVSGLLDHFSLSKQCSHDLDSARNDPVTIFHLQEKFLKMIVLLVNWCDKSIILFSIISFLEQSNLLLKIFYISGNSVVGWVGNTLTVGYAGKN